MYYSKRSKYFGAELSFRALCTNMGWIATVEKHAKNWQGARDRTIMSQCLLGFDNKFGRPGNNDRIWIVARRAGG